MDRVNRVTPKSRPRQPGQLRFEVAPTISNVTWANATGGAAGGRVTWPKVSMNLAANPAYESVTAEYVGSKPKTVGGRRFTEITIRAVAGSADKPKANQQADRVHKQSVEVPGFFSGTV